MGMHAFDQLVELETAWIRLDCAALHLARDAYPHIDLLTYLRRLDRMAEEVSARRPGLDAASRYQAMREVLVDEYDLHGDEDDYYNPENAYLNRAIDRGRGMPIMVATVWLEVARRLKWPVVGLGFPGHFLIRFDDEERYIIIDPFHSGRTLSREDCQEVLNHCFEGRVELKDNFLKPVDTRVILARMLNNLRSIYLTAQDWPALERVLRRLVALEPNQGRHIQELASLRYRLGDVRAAYAHLARYIKMKPKAPDRAAVRERMDHLVAAIAALN